MPALQGLCSKCRFCFKSISIEGKDFDFMILRHYSFFFFFLLCLFYNFLFFQRLEVDVN